MIPLDQVLKHVEWLDEICGVYVEDEDAVYITDSDDPDMKYCPASVCPYWENEGEFIDRTPVEQLALSWKNWLMFVLGGWHGYAKDRAQIMIAAEITWETCHRIILEACLALAPLKLPPYVLLEILNWVPFVWDHEHRLKIGLILGMKESIEKVMDAR